MAEARGQETAPALDEPSLLARLRAGEDEAFEELVRLYGGRMLPSVRAGWINPSRSYLRRVCGCMSSRRAAVEMKMSSSSAMSYHP